MIIVKPPAMICLVAALLIGVVCVPVVAAADIDIRSDTIIRGFERRAYNGDDKPVSPVYAYPGIDYRDGSQGGLSLQLYGWGRKDPAVGEFFEDDPDGEPPYGYLLYRKPDRRLHLDLVRRHIFTGDVDHGIGGLKVGAGFGPYVSATVFGGRSIEYQDQNDGTADAAYGTRVAHHNATHYEFGLSYQKTGTGVETAEEKAGADLMLNLGSWLTVSGLSNYNLNSEDWLEHRYNAKILISGLMVEPSYQYFSYQDSVGKGAHQNNIFHFLQDNEEILAIAGTDVVWQGLGPVDLGVRGRRYEYDIRQESALYVAGLLMLNTSNGSQIGVEVGRMDGETIDNIYDLYRGYFYWQQPFNLAAQGFISGDALYVAYEAPIFGEDKSVQYTLSAGRYFFDKKLETKLSGIYSQDPYINDDVGGVVTLQIHY